MKQSDSQLPLLGLFWHWGRQLSIRVLASAGASSSASTASVPITTSNSTTVTAHSPDASFHPVTPVVGLIGIFPFTNNSLFKSRFFQKTRKIINGI
ncbi:MAG TPA: hypothetical protein VMB80_14220 [Candidatus Acidoferrum sp.]|nr:hypothetical protein [Candidatus Acidoferrum sp.]